MFGPRAVHIFICSISLVAAGCANTSVPETQTSAGGAPPRPKTVLVNDFAFSSDVAVVDRGFAARLESKLGSMTYDVVKAITARRVNDEIVATAVVLVRAQGLNARQGGEGELKQQNGALVVTGRVHAVNQGNHPPRNPVGFDAGNGVVADVTVSELSEGTQKPLLTFTAQAQNGRRSAEESDAPAFSAAIGTLLAARSAPDVNLSPGVEALARGLGRAVADRIVAYAGQQGWVTKGNFPAPPEDATPVKRRPENLAGAAAKRDASPDPTHKFPCEAFTKKASGNWYVKGPVTVDIGSAENQTLQDLEIPPKFFTIGGVDLYATVQNNCHGWQPTVRLPK